MRITKIKWIITVAMLGVLASCCEHNDWQVERAIHLEKDMARINALTPSHTEKLNLDEIIEIAYANNLDLMLKDQEVEIQIQYAIRDQLKMIPQLIANGEISNRNNDLIVSSKSTVPGVPPAPPSISTERHVERYDINLIFNLLDFGLSYFKAQQETKRVLMLAMEYERLRQDLVVDITKQFWKAVAAKVAIEESYELIASAQEFQKRITDQMNHRDISKVNGLKTKADLINLQIQISEFNVDYESGMSELTLLMGLTPCTRFELDYKDDRSIDIELPDVFELETMALLQRPELFARDIEEQITIDEVRYAFLQMLPGAELFAGDWFDSNKYFTHNHWIVAGARATWNIFALPHRYADVKASKKRQDLVRLHRMALSVGVLSQVHLAYILTSQYFEQYQLVHSLEITNQELLLYANNELEAGSLSGSETLFIGLQTLLSKHNAIKAYGDLQISLEQINHAIGSPRYFKSFNQIEAICP